MELKLSALAGMTEASRNDALAALARDAKGAPNGQLAKVDREIREYELRYEMTSEQMRKRFRAGAFADTADVARWLLLADARARASR